ncbi:Hypothetical protein SRAE_X000132300 [Strongyloides ratti]|uniref:PiggyBac transposable element-derived protein domain-containing protein n=1 Tax=Strongyloides ratti TaxID=34506 RepID=A0A090MNC6_STRRB|nr:Hypothetical protein SRAE_X000132300 [Strongyloides ratti]CEF59576.1 Hypothetical protein SRAE_X000132300 [Strongyloides ratti]
MNSFQLNKEIPDETAAVKSLQKRGLIPEAKECENGHEIKLSFGAGTKMPLKTVIMFIYYWANKDSSGERIKRELDVSPVKTVDWNSLLKEVCLFMEKKNENKIGGKGLTVEVDETLFAQRKNAGAAVVLWRDLQGDQRMFCRACCR